MEYLLGKSDDPTPMLSEATLSYKERQAVAAWRQGQYTKAVKIIIDDDPLNQAT
jgi:hypothetical protein